MDEHPTDRQGRRLPDAGYPAGKAAPGRLEQLRRFVNSANLESGADRLVDPADAATWLRAEGWSPDPLAAPELVRLQATRELLRQLAASNRDGRRDVESWRALLRIGGDRVGVAVRDDRPQLVGGEDIASELVAIAVASTLDGTWPRLKACRNERCRWLVYDRTRSGSNEWCSMSACGQRLKQRRYRARLERDQRTSLGGAR